jgi:hypothetical protein
MNDIRTADNPVRIQQAGLSGEVRRTIPKRSGLVCQGNEGGFSVSH